MNKNDLTILVTGATGQQGGAVARHLLKEGWQVRAFVRNTDSEGAQALAGDGAELVQGDLEDSASIENAMQCVYGVFSFPNMASGLEGEIRQSKAVADVAKATGIQHFVQSSVGGVERNSGVPHFESKWQIESYVKELGLPATSIRPAYFMENFNWRRSQILDGTLESMGMTDGKSLQMISVDDIGAFTAIVFNDPEKYIGQSLEIAGDDLSEAQSAEVFAGVLNKEVTFIPQQTKSPYEDMAIMVEWFNTDGYEADIDNLRVIHPGLMTLESWIKQSDWVN